MNPMHSVPANPSWTGTNAEEIEQRIIRAYLRLACTAQERDGIRSVTVTRFGGLEVRLTEIPLELVAPGMPTFWLEVYSHENHAVIDSCGCSEFDERELADAVDLVERAMRRSQPVQ